MGPGKWNVWSAKLDVDTIPTTTVIDRNGVLRHDALGLPPEALIKKRLAETPEPRMQRMPVRRNWAKGKQKKEHQSYVMSLFLHNCGEAEKKFLQTQKPC
jgi:hypothetical protein